MVPKLNAATGLVRETDTRVIRIKRGPHLLCMQGCLTGRVRTHEMHAQRAHHEALRSTASKPIENGTSIAGHPEPCLPHDTATAPSDNIVDAGGEPTAQAAGVALDIYRSATSTETRSILAARLVPCKPRCRAHEPLPHPSHGRIMGEARLRAVRTAQRHRLPRMLGSRWRAVLQHTRQ